MNGLGSVIDILMLRQLLAAFVQFFKYDHIHAPKRRRIKEEFHLNCTVGILRRKFLRHHNRISVLACYLIPRRPVHQSSDHPEAFPFSKSDIVDRIYDGRITVCLRIMGACRFILRRSADTDVRILNVAKVHRIAVPRDGNRSLIEIFPFIRGTL